MVLADAGPDIGLMDIADLFTREELKGMSYWSTRSNALAMTCWGTSQLLEAQLAIAAWLGWRQKSEEWGTYTRRVTDAIREL